MRERRECRRLASLGYIFASAFGGKAEIGEIMEMMEAPEMPEETEGDGE